MTIFFANHMLRKHITSMILFVVLFFEVFVSKNEIILADENLNMYSGAYALSDGDTDRILCGKNLDTPMANASTTKILTCIVALENVELDEVVHISEKAASQPKVKLGVQEGDTYQMKELLYGLMLESYNDCAVAIAEHVAGSTEAFAKKMNEKAKEIGCKDTYFITPNGLDAEDEVGFHHTTAEDLCKIMAYCTWESPKKEMFLEITQTSSYGEFVNKNSFLEQMEGVLTGKTGFTNKAGYCYVAALEKNGEKYCIALLACGWPNNKDYKWKDARTLFEYGLENYEMKEVIIKPYFEEVYIDGYATKANWKQLNTGQNLGIVAKEHKYSLLLRDDEKVKAEAVLYPMKKLPFKKGAKMGECRIYIGDLLVDVYPVVSSENTYMWGMKDIIYTIFYQFLTFSF